MRKLIIVLAAVLALSCAQPTEIIQTISLPPANVRVYDSAWDIILEARVDPSRDLTTTSALQSEVDAYNSSHFDDQRFLVSGESTIPPESAPMARAYLVASSDYAPLASYTIPRSALVDTRESWRIEATRCGALLYVDRDPPDYIPPRVVTDYERYALYVIDNVGAIVYEDHCEAWESGGYGSISNYFDIRSRMFQSAVDGASGDTAPWRLVSGQLYP